MPVAKLRKVGGSVMVAIPPSILEEAKISEGSEVEVTMNDREGSIALRPARPRFTLAELLAEVDLSLEDDEETKAWLADRPRGSEMI